MHHQKIERNTKKKKKKEKEEKEINYLLHERALLNERIF